MANLNVNETSFSTKVFGGLSRFLHPFKRTPAGYGLINLDMQLWTVDGTAGAVYTADAGTDGQQQHPVLQFATATADDLAFCRFVMPPDYNREVGEIFLLWYWYEAGTTNTQKAVWAGKVRRIPAGETHTSGSDYSGNVALDGAGVAFTAVTAYTDGSANEIGCTKIDLTTSSQAAAIEPLDLVQLYVYNDQSEDTLAQTPYVCGAAIMYSR